MPAHFQDASSGRTIVLRGVNLADGKQPYGQPSHLLSSLDTSAADNVSYVDTPFSVASAGAHLGRLRRLGFTVLRVPVVWEALEHGGPGVYDEAYLAHLRALVACATRDHGFRVLLNPHQDLWSRFAGGSGAPLWTLHACGLAPDRFGDTHAAVRYAEWPSAADDENKDPKCIPPMMWTSNHTRLAASTLFALFWAGRHVAPRCVLDGVNIQDYLQGHYLRAYARLAEVLGDDDLAWGWDSMNEPEPGFLGWQDLARNEREASAMMGSAPTPIQGMRLGMGIAQAVDTYKLSKTGPHKDGVVRVEPAASCWLQREDPRWPWRRSDQWPLGTCVWALHGVWDVDTGELKKPAYFATSQDTDKDWKSTYWKDFFDKWVATIRTHCPSAITFVQTPVFEPPPPNLLSSLSRPDLTAYSPHFYDALTIMKKHWHKNWNVDIISLLRGRQDISNKIKALRLGGKNVHKVISDQLGALATDVTTLPTLIGETGIPFNLDQGKAYRDGDYTNHVTALDAILSGCDDHLLNYTLWDYSALNTHEWGDHWNGEDLSIYCAETHNTTNTTGSFPPRGHEYLSGFRAAAAWCRPHVQSLSRGTAPVRMLFDLKTSRFELEIQVESSQQQGGGRGGDVVVYVPWLHYRKSDDNGDGTCDELDLKVDLSHGSWSLDTEQTLLCWRYETGGRLSLKMERAGGALSPRELGTVLSV